MTSRDFIIKQFGNDDGKTKYLSSIVKDGNGNIYSYGYHYPLLFNIAGCAVINTRGYSNTTGRHIHWAWSAAGSDAIGVELAGGDRLPLTLATIELRLCEQSDRLTKVLWDIKRKDTARYTGLNEQLEQIGASLDRVRAINTDPSRNIVEHPSIDNLSSVAAVMALGDIFSDDQSGANDWKIRMLKAGVPDGLIMPEDWDQLSEDDKTARLDGVIKALGDSK